MAIRFSSIIPRSSFVTAHLAAPAGGKAPRWLQVAVFLVMPLAGLRGESTIASARPLAVCPGRGVEVTLGGEGLGAEDLVLWTSFAATSTRVPSGDAQAGDSAATFLVTAGEDVQLGVGVLRLVSPRGASNPFLILIDDLDASAESGGERISLPLAVDGECVEDRESTHAFDVEPGERWTFDVVAQRLGSQLDPVVRLLDPAGRELVFCDDADGLGADVRFAHTFETGGRHRIALRAVDYQGGPSRRYRLRIGDFPAVAAVFPMGARSGREASLLARERGAARVFSFTPGRPERRARVTVPGRRGSGFVAVAVSPPGDPDELVEAEDIDGSVETGTRISIPQVVNGRFDVPGDRDAFRLKLAGAQRIVLEGRTRGLGSAAELHLELRRASGEVLARSRSEGSDEGVLVCAVEEAGEYVLVVEELNLQGGEGYFYRLAARLHQPSFGLSLDVERVKVRRGGELVLKVGCERRGHDGAIELGLEDAPEGFEVLEGKIARGKESGEIRVKVPDSAEVGRLFPTSVVGRAGAADAPLRVRASTAAALNKLFPRLRYFPEILEDRLAIVVTD